MTWNNIATPGSALFLAALGILLALAIIIPAVQKSNRQAREQQARAALPPAGWHPDPRGEATLRWWDGGAWTEHTS